MKTKSIHYVTAKQVPARFRPVAQTICDCMDDEEDAHFVDGEKDMRYLFFTPADVVGFFRNLGQGDEAFTRKDVAAFAAWLRSRKLTLFVLGETGPANC